MPFGIPRARLVAYVVGGSCALGVVCGWPAPRESSAYDQRLTAIWHRKMAADEARLRAADSAVTHDSIHVTRNVYRYRAIRDTLNIHDTVQVIRFVERADSVVRACTELQSVCALYRTRAESVIADLHVENDALAAEVKALHGSRMMNAWAKIRLPLAFVAGAYLGAKVTR